MNKTYNREVSLGENLPEEELMKEDNISIVVWPDNEWCFVEDLEEHMRDAGKSDDYAIKEVHVSLEEDDIDEYVCAYNQGESPD